MDPLAARPRSRSICGCPIWDFLFVPARYDMEFRGRLLGPRGFHPCPLRGSRPTQAGSTSPGVKLPKSVAFFLL
jgi:hypothetical protein